MRPKDDTGVALQPRGAIFLIRAWTEDNQFRARIRCSIEIFSPTHPFVEAVTADPEDVHRLLAAWIDELAAGPPAEDD